MTPDSNELLARVEAERIDSAFAEGVRACLQRLYAANVRTDEHHVAWEDCEALWRTRTDQVIASRVERKAAPTVRHHANESLEESEYLLRVSSPLPSDDVRSALESLSDWCSAERSKLGAVDGYDYRSGEEFGICSVQIEIDKRVAALRSAPVSGPAKATPIPHIDALDDIGSDGSFPLENSTRAKSVPAVGETREALAQALCCPLGCECVSDCIAGGDRTHQAQIDPILALSPVPDATVSEPVAWTIPGNDQADCNGFIPTKVYCEGEFTKPLYTSPQHVDREATVSARDGVIEDNLCEDCPPRSYADTTRCTECPRRRSLASGAKP